MSVTITIRSNAIWAKDNDQLNIKESDCLCVSPNGEAIPTCLYCKGSGKIRYPELPFELNLTNTNFSTLWNAFGLDVDKEEYKAQEVLDALEVTPVESIVRAPDMKSDTDDFIHTVKKMFGMEGVVVHSHGLDLDQAQRYVDELRPIVYEAKRRGKPIVWH